MDREDDKDKSEEATLYDPYKLKTDDNVCYKKSDIFCEKYNIRN